MKLYEDFKKWAIKELKTKRNPKGIKDTLITLVRKSKNFEQLEIMVSDNDIEGEPLWHAYWELFSKFFK